MATKRRKVRKSRRSCKNGKLKKPIRTKSGRKRRCKKRKIKSRKNTKSKRRKKRKYKMKSLKEMSRGAIRRNGMLQNIPGGYERRREVIRNLPNEQSMLLEELMLPAQLSDISDEMLLNIFENSSLDELSKLYKTNRRLRGIAVDIVRRRYTQKEMADHIHEIIDTGDNIKVLRMLLDAGADPNYKIIDHHYYYDGLTYLIAAVDDNRPEIVRILLKYGADPNVTEANEDDDENESALQIAVRNIREEIVKLLLEAGADRNGITKDYVFSDDMESWIWIKEARIWTMLSGERPEENINAYDWPDLEPDFMDDWPTKVEPKNGHREIVELLEQLNLEPPATSPL